jgi:tetratricopeptide (TPR) repeat protein
MLTLRLFSLELSCPYELCDNPEENSQYSIINKKLRQLFRKIEWGSDETILIGGYGYADWKNSFVPDEFTLREEHESVLGVRSYCPKYVLTWGEIEREEASVERTIEIFSRGGDLEEQSRDFCWKTFHDSAELFSQLCRDLDLFIDEETQYLELKIKDLKRDLVRISKSSYHVDSDGLYISSAQIRKDYENDMSAYKKEIEKISASHKSRLKVLYSIEGEVNEIFRQIYTSCLDKHNNYGARYELGMIDFYEGKTLDAFFNIKKLITQAELAGNLQALSSEVELLNGKLCNELTLYQDAIVALSHSIDKNPENKEAYFERAIAYFETGQLDLSIGDYLQSHMKSQPIDPSFKDKVDFSLGLSLGIVKGGVEGLVDYVPSMFSSIEGLSHGLWAFAQDPVQVSKDLLDATYSCLNFVRENSTQEVLLTLVPELQTLVHNWDTLPDTERGEIAGLVIGKYGVDIFAGAGIAKCMNAYRNLKKANNLMTFEAAAISERNKAQIAFEAQKRVEIRKHIISQDLKIDWGKQGKHIKDHENYKILDKKSILVHSDPQKLFDKCGGKGMPHRGNPGVAGYQEIEDFGEFIGYAVNYETGEQIATNWGKIHYAKDGVHIVPTRPRE